MQENTPYRPEELLYRMGHSTRAMDAFFSMDKSEREAALNRIATAPEGHEEAQMEQEMARLESLGEEYGRPIR